MTRLTALVLLGIVLSASEPALFAAERPNFIIFVADDMAWNDAGCYGHPHIRTPHIDRLAKDGMRFDNAFLTISSCSPSRCSMLTGRYPHNTGAGELHLPLPADQILFTAPLRKSGYYTASAGKWHLGQAAKQQIDRVFEGGGPSGCGHWLEALRTRPKDKPFFLWLAAVDPHRGYQPNTIEQPHSPQDAVVPPYLPDVPETRKDLAMYYDEIARLDSFVGKVMDELKRDGVDKNTLVLFISDNGRPFPRCKTTVYDSGIKTPFVVRWPARIKASGKQTHLVSTLDIAPTLLELAGVEVADHFQGKSFASMLDDSAQSIRDYVFAEHNWHDYQAHERAVRSEKYLYIRNALVKLPGTPPADAVRSPTFLAMQRLRKDGKLTADQQGCFLTPRPAEELYDVQSDPHQLHNLAGDPQHAAILRKMATALDQWMLRTEDRVADEPTPDGFDRESGKKLIEGAHPKLSR